MWNDFSNFRRRERACGAGFTLIEVVAGLALLATLLVALLTARARYTLQYHTAERRIQAVGAADALLREWWEKPKAFPRDDFGQTSGPVRFRWRTQVIESETLKDLEAEIVRLELSDPQLKTNEPVLSIDVVVPKEVKPSALLPR